MNAGAARDGRQHCEAFCGVNAYVSLKDAIASVFGMVSYEVQQAGFRSSFGRVGGPGQPSIPEIRRYPFSRSTSKVVATHQHANREDHVTLWYAYVMHIMTQTNIVWDEVKRLKNIRDHEVDFVDIDDAFFMDYYALTLADNRHSEPRFVTVARNGVGVILFVCYAYENNGDIALISARRADASERRQYEERR
jgi:uncharacterized protein